MHLIVEANVHRLGHLPCPSHCLSFANLFVACWSPWPRLYPAGKYLGAAVESSLFKGYAAQDDVFWPQREVVACTGPTDGTQL